MKRPTSTNDRLFLALTTIVVLAPLPLASNRPWSWSLLSLCVGLLTMAWAVARLRGTSRPGLPLVHLAVPALLFLAAVAWATLQSLSLFPESWNHPVWAEASAALGRGLDGSISGDPQKTGHAVMRLLAYGLTFLLATQLGRQHHRAAKGLTTVALAATIYAAAAMTTFLFGFEYILWLPKWAYLGDATGTFVGRAGFGTFVGIGILAALAHAIQGSPSHRPVSVTADRIERLLSRTLPWLIAATGLWCAMLASHSRGALLSTGLACGVLILGASISGIMRPRHAIVLLLAFAAIAGTATLVNGQATLSRFFTEADLSGDRPNLFRLTWAAINDSPLLGHGLGAFDNTFRPYRDYNLPRSVVYDYAHNTWQEVIMDLGWPAGLCLIGAVVGVVATCCVGAIRRRQHQIYPIMAVSCAVLLGSQAVTDFAIQLPALATMLAYILGIGYGQSWSTKTTAAA